MKYQLFVVGEMCWDASGTVENEDVVEIASSNQFGDFKTLIEQLDQFGTDWEVTETEAGVTVTVFSSDAAVK